MVYEVPASKRSIKQNRFEFKIGSKKYSFPLADYLPIRAGVLAEAEDAVGMYRELASGDDELYDALMGLDKAQTEALFAAWQEASGVDLGESPASPTS